MYYPDLRVVGWTSSYKSVQQALNKLKKKKYTDGQAGAFLDSILLLCNCTGKDPDEIVGLGRSCSKQTTDAVVTFMNKHDFSKDELNFRLACVVTFLDCNKAF
jgi:hypothetical protein